VSILCLSLSALIKSLSLLVSLFILLHSLDDFRKVYKTCLLFFFIQNFQTPLVPFITRRGSREKK
jgi:hypothetical protein